MQLVHIRHSVIGSCLVVWGGKILYLKTEAFVELFLEKLIQYFRFDIYVTSIKMIYNSLKKLVKKLQKYGAFKSSKVYINLFLLLKTLLKACC